MNYWIQYLPRPIPFMKRKAVIHIDLPISEDSGKLHRVLEFPVRHGCNISVNHASSPEHGCLFHIEVDISGFDLTKTNEYVGILHKEL